MNLIGLSLHARKFPGAAARSFLIGGALACLAGVTSVQATPTLSTAAYPNDGAYYLDQQAFLARSDVTQVDFRFPTGETWDTSTNDSLWSHTFRDFGSVSSLGFSDGVTLTGLIRLFGLGNAGESLPYRTDFHWLPSAPLLGVPTVLQELLLTFADPISELSLHLVDFGDNASYNFFSAINGPNLTDLHFEALLDDTSVLSQTAFTAIADDNRDGRGIFLDAGDASFNQVRLTFGGVFPDGDPGDVVVIDSIAFASTSVPEASSLAMLLSALGLLAMLARRRRTGVAPGPLPAKTSAS